MGSHRLFSLSAMMAAVVLLLCLLEGTWALKCRTEDGPSSDEVRKVIRTCMKRISTEMKNKSNEEDDDTYGNYDSSYSDSEIDENGEAKTEENTRRQSNSGNGGGSGQSGNTRGRNGDNRNSDRENGRNSDDRQSNGGRRRDRDWDYNIGAMERNPHGRYKRQYYNDGVHDSYGYQQNNRYNRDRNNFMNPTSGNNTSNGSNNVERDRACLMQCFFQEMKMTNNEGLPDKHKVLHVVTKDLRDYELRDFYTDSIQECFHMISVDNRIRDKCDYSMRFVTCLADRGQANCNDWENETLIF